ncbi:MAG: phosphoenolpyruvate--protein phosphotransferase [Chlamydiia bacterium]
MALLEITPVTQERRIHGLPVAAGIAMGPPYIVQSASSQFQERVLTPRPGESRVTRSLFKVEQEITRFRKALDQSRIDVQQAQTAMENEGVKVGADILDAHLMMLHDPMITDYIEDQVRRTEQALEHVIQGFIQECERKFSRIADDAFRLRLQDIQDVINRIMGHLTLPTSHGSPAAVPLGAVVFLREAAPSMVAEAQRFKVAGFVTVIGGETSHAAIIARAKGIPFVSRIDLTAEMLKDVQIVIVDAYSGVVVLDPMPETIELYTRRAAELCHARAELDQQRAKPARTLDQHVMRVSGSVKLADELPQLEDRGCEGIGLYRTECMFGDLSAGFPCEDVQFHAYCVATQAARRHAVVIRVFDVGGDKPGGCAIDRDLSMEQNPFLGCRGVRFLLRHPQILHTQLRALWRASLYGPLKVLIPMVTTLDEVLAVRQCMLRAREELQQEGCLLPMQLELGVMVEVPACALLADQVAPHVDFFSLGTNDLVQYTLAVERGNSTLSHLFSAFDPAVLRLIEMTAQAAQRFKRPICLCGEMAGDVRAVPLLMGLGIQELAVSLPFVPVIKHVVRSFSLADAQILARTCVQLPNAAAVRRQCEEFLAKACPIAMVLA